MELSKYIACLCEGTAEEVIVNILLGFYPRAQVQF